MKIIEMCAKGLGECDGWGEWVVLFCSMVMYEKCYCTTLVLVHADTGIFTVFFQIMLKAPINEESTDREKQIFHGLHDLSHHLKSP